MVEKNTGKTLVIVESPNKIKAIQKYLQNYGVNCDVEATVGHIALLPTTGKDGLGIDTENWVPLYKVDPTKRKIVNNLKKIAQKAQRVVIATDHDREGEAIADNLVEYLNISDKYDRITFNEITEAAIVEAYKKPGKIDEQLVNAQKARRMLDRIIGFRLSKLMRQNIKNSLVNPSAGRVQSIALKLVVEREKEVVAFVPKEYYEIEAEFSNGTTAKYFDPNKTNNKEWISLKKIDDIFNNLEGPLVVQDIISKTRSDASIVPLKQATLYKKSSLSSAAVQSAAQRLYEGYDEKGGLITYPRTDSTRYSASFVKHAKKFILNNFGPEYVGTKVRGAKAGAQDAHEAIRPTSLSLTPAKAQALYNLNAADYNVYSLIYKTTMQSLIKPAERSITSYVYENNNHKFRNSFSKIVFDGYLVLEENKDVSFSDPKYRLNQKVDVNQYVKTLHATKPPARFSEGSLISKLDEIKVGRPSTFATTVKIIKDREYVKREGTALIPTEFGNVVCDQLTKYFPRIINEKYTAFVEEELDLIASDNKPVQIVMNDFNDNFNEVFEHATKVITPTFLVPNILEDKCPDDNGDLIERRSRAGDHFIGCLNFPKCKFTRSLPKKKTYRKRYTKK